MIDVNQRITFNISGSLYETYEATLQKFPQTLLGDLNRRQKYYENNVYFFNRSRVAFDAVLFYYQSNGCLVRPPSIPMELFELECLFYDLGRDAIRQMKEKEGYDSNKKVNELSVTCHTNKRMLDILWRFFEWPESSIFARIYTFLSLLLIVFAVIMDCFETSPSMVKPRNKKLQFDEWEYVKLSLNFFFAIEYFLRLISAPRKCHFLRSASNVIDFFAIYPSFLIYFINAEVIENIMFVRVLRTLRIFRLVRLSRSFETLSVVLHILSKSATDLLTLVFCMLISCVCFGGAIYYTEIGVKDTQITSIPEGMWFSMQTVVAIGYGDVVPSSTLGKITASITAVFGALTMTVPLLSLGGRYFSIYTKTFDSSLTTDLITTPGPGVERLEGKMKRK